MMQILSGDTGEWLLVFNDDIKTIESFLENSMMQILSGILTVFGIVIAMFYENKGIAVFFCIYVLISVGYIIQMQKKKQSYLAKERSRKSEYISAMFYENKGIAVFFCIYVLISVGYIIQMQKKKQSYLAKERSRKSEYISSCYEWYQARKDIKNSGKIPSIFRELKCRMQGYGDSMVLAQKALYSIWMVSLFVVFLGNAIALLKIPSIFRELKCRMQGYGDSMVLAQKALYSIWMVSLFVVFLGNAIALLGGGILAFQNLISIGTVYLFYSYGQQLKAPMDDLQTLMRNLLSLHTSLLLWPAVKSPYG